MPADSLREDGPERPPSAWASGTATDVLLELLEDLPDAVSIFTPVRDGQGTVVDVRYEFANAAATAASGHGIGELAGRSLLEVRPDLPRRAVLEMFRTVLDSGTTWKTPAPVATGDAFGGDQHASRYLDVRVMKLHGRVLVLARDMTEWLERDREIQFRSRQLEDATATARALTRLVRGMHALQLCSSLDEAVQIIARTAPLVFDQSSGAVYTPAPGGSSFTSLATWGDFTGSDLMKMDDCWALRSFAIHLFGEDPLALRCQHASRSADWTACIPLIAQGEPLALIHLQDGGVSSDRVRELVEVVSTQWGLTLANLRLQESLRNQSVRDPLTGLFNRRFLDEALEEEINRAERHETPLCVVMLDVDHFKAFNDTHGHIAGDTVLRDLGRFFLEATRGSDVVGRFGGEEFLMIMPHMTRDAGKGRIEDLLRDWRVRGRTPGTDPIFPTVSAGMAYHVRGRSSAELLGAADRALYGAKAAGRDRVVVDPAPDAGQGT